jgi:Arc/MetJ family transcription regulator
MGHKRTNIEIDEGLVAEAMERYGTRTMRETVDLALRVLVGEPMSTEDALALRGSGWEGDLEQQRAGWDGTRGGSLAAIDGTTADATSTAE